MPERIEYQSLKQQVYDYLRRNIRTGKLQPGEAIRLDETAGRLGCSRTPLREACLQLELEGFLTIVPRVGIYVKPLTPEEIREHYQVIGALESAAVRLGLGDMTDRIFHRMQELNNRMANAIEKEDFERFYRHNLAFHDCYIEPAANESLHHHINRLKRRLYDFLPADRWIREWELESLEGHQLLLECLKGRDLERARWVLTDLTWDYETHEPFIRRYYGFEVDENEPIRPNPYRPLLQEWFGQ